MTDRSTPADTAYVSKKRLLLKRVKHWFGKFKSPFVIVMSLIIALECFTFIYALYWGLITSLKSLNNFSTDFFGFPEKLMFSNYIVAFRRLYVTIESGAGSRNVMFGELLWNSLSFAVLTTVLSVFSRAAVAYVVCKYRFAFNKVLHFAVVLSIVVPPMSSLGSTLNLYRTLGIYDNFLPYAYLSIGFADMNFLIWYGVFKGISSEFMEAARIDGAGHWRIMLTVMFPLARVPFMILFVLGFIAGWNGYYPQLTYLPSMPNLALSLWKLQYNTTNEIAWPHMQIAIAMIVAAPCLLLYIIFQRWFVGNLTMGGLKG